MILQLTCSRCQRAFEQECSDTDGELPPCHSAFHETQPVCDECEHEFLAWTGCHPIM
jgi:hypothetical protein